MELGGYWLATVSASLLFLYMKCGQSIASRTAQFSEIWGARKMTLWSRINLLAAHFSVISSYAQRFSFSFLSPDQQSVATKWCATHNPGSSRKKKEKRNLWNWKLRPAAHEMREQLFLGCANRWLTSSISSYASRSFFFFSLRSGPRMACTSCEHRSVRTKRKKRKRNLCASALTLSWTWANKSLNSLLFYMIWPMSRKVSRA